MPFHRYPSCDPDGNFRHVSNEARRQFGRHPDVEKKKRSLLRARKGDRCKQLPQQAAASSCDQISKKNTKTKHKSTRGNEKLTDDIPRSMPIMPYSASRVKQWKRINDNEKRPISAVLFGRCLFCSESALSSPVSVAKTRRVAGES